MEFFPTDLLMHFINILVLFLLLRLILFKARQQLSDGQKRAYQQSAR